MWSVCSFSEFQNPRCYLELEFNLFQSSLPYSDSKLVFFKALGDDQNEGLQTPKPEVPNLVCGEELLFISLGFELRAQNLEC